MDNQRKLSNEQGLFHGRYRARVVNNRHPKKWHMASVRVLGYMDDIADRDLPWAEYMLPLGARAKEGDMMPVQAGDLVWVSFEEGDTRKPIIEGAAYSVDGRDTGESLLPQDAWNKKYSHKRTDKQPAPPVHAYGDKVFDQMTFLQQLTMSGEYCLTHKPSGTAIHVNKKGQLVVHVEHDRYDSTSGNKTEEVTKNLELIVKGNVTRTITGNLTEKVGGDYEIDVAGTTTRKSGGTMRDSAAQIHHN
ncbi:phage baseplate assembly protein V [Vibrio sonorensis]|uniref:phage baseplate assembly protein V n=1 Tax=Vibrio sonorensis TaxID=1004316 RepID=UPI0008D903C0|nr:phage baseplate assembly protein V [Vibrio sonorensis]